MGLLRNLYIYIGIVAVAAVTAIVALLVSGLLHTSSGEGVEYIKADSTVLAYVIKNPNFSITTIYANSTHGNISLPIKAKVSIMTFQYIRCPDICHWESYVFVYLMNKTASYKLGNDIVFLTIDVDPWRSTFEDVISYQRSRAGKLLDSVSWIWVLDSVDKMVEIWRDFRIFVARSDDLITHSAGFYIFDRDGRLVYIIQPTQDGWRNLDKLAQEMWKIIYNTVKGG
jgi:protein SCO1/2